MKFLFIFVLLLCTLPFVTEGQISNQRCKWVKTFDEPFALDTLSIDESSLTFTNTNNSQISFEHDINTGLVIINSTTKVDSVFTCYRVFPIAMHQSIYNRSLDQYDSNAMFKDPKPLTNPTDKRDELFQMDDMTKGGSIGRSISFGNSQDVFVNSTLNLTLNGKLAENLNIRASITDQNVPFQPEGNTQHLQEFDNVFIQLYSDKMSLTGGDIVLKNKPGYFLRNYKNVQGGLFTANYTLGDSSNTASTTIGASVAKGQFSSVTLNVSEGVLGPYKIQGPQNQSFVIVLANSERVFLDGKRLERGFNLDYIIDYNRGEITFTNRILITKFSRVRIDYEFSDQNYSRTITSLSQYQTLGKVDFFFNAYTEKDSRNKPLISDLSQEDKIFLSNSGDAIDGNFTNQFDSIGYFPDRILYKKVDTIDFDGQPHSVFIFSNSPDSAVYDVSFVEVGLGMGNYVLKEASYNGRVYEWVSPSVGVLQGNYEALRPLVAPSKKQLITFGGKFNINQHENISAEVGISDHDNNLFSPLDDGDNNGQALKIGFESNSRPLGKENGYKFSSNINFEFNSRDFKAIDRFRYIEFDRDWSYSPRSLDPKFEDKIFTTSINLKKDVSNALSYKLVSRKKGSLINGLQHYLSLQQLFGKLQISSDAFLMNNDRLKDRSEWQRLNVDISFLMKNVVPGYVYGLDKNVVTDLSDSVISSAMNSTSHTFYLKNPENAKAKYDARYVYREDNLPVDGEIQLNSRSHTGSFNLSSEISNKHTLGVQFIYRNLENIANLSSGRNEETISGRIDWLGNMLDNNLRMEVNYTLSNSRELRREFSYLQVPTGEGTHTWRDLNDDSIQDLNEFFLAINPDEQNYIKLFVPTNDFISAFDNLLNYRLNVNFPSKWRGQGGLKEFLSRFSNNTSWTSHHKIVDSNLDARLVPFLVNLKDDDVLSVRETMRSTLFYNRSNPKFGLSFTTFNNKRKQLLTNGFDARNSHGLEFTNRINISRFYNFKITSTRSVNNSSSDFLQGRDFKIRQLKLSPVISWQPSPKMRISTTYSISDKKNSSDFEEPGNAVINELSTEFRLNNATKSSLIANFRYIDIDFEGEENTPLGYELLQALRPGSNFSWMVNFQKKLTSGLQINLTYEARKSPSVDLVQIGRVQVTALF